MVCVAGGFQRTVLNIALASYSPKLAISAGGPTLAAAAALKKNWSWCVVGTLLLAVGLFFQQNSNKNGRNKLGIGMKVNKKQNKILGRAR